MEKKKTAKQKFDEVIGIIVISVIALFLARYFLTNLEPYRELESSVARTIRLPQAVEKVSETLGFEDKGREGLQERIAARTKERLPYFEIEIPAQKPEKIEYESVLLCNKDYYSRLKSALRKAQNSIYVAMYVVAMGESATDPVKKLLDELIAAKNRGLEVKVVMECPRRAGGSLYERNSEALDYLLKEGVEATFNDPKRELHDKFVLIDKDTIFLGNHNWSKQSLTINREVSVMVKSDPPDPEFIKHFAGIRLAKPEDTKQGRIKLIKEIYRQLLKRTAEATT